MRKSVLLLTAMTLLVCGTIVAAEDEMCVPMGEITIVKLAREAKRSEVLFPHSVHFDYACRQCHHKWNSQEPIVGCQTSGCHDLAAKPETKDSTQKLRYYKEAYHGLCIGCHREIKRDNKALETSLKGVSGKLPVPGPTACNLCHPVE